MDRFGISGAKFRHLTCSGEVGRGEADFAVAAESIMSLGMHNGTGVDFWVDGASPAGRPGASGSDPQNVKVGDVVRLRIGPAWLGAVAITGACDVIEVFDDPRHRGFTYRARADHPLEGEETFEVRWLADDRVVATVESWSHARNWLSHLGGPLLPIAQNFGNRRYVASTRHIVQQ